MEIVAIDIGGTHARFAIAEVSGGKAGSLRDIATLKTAEHASFQLAWRAYADRLGRPLPRAAAIAVAGRITDTTLKLTNNPWTITPARLAQELAVDRHIILNDFGAVAHAVAQAGPDQFMHIAGPNTPLPDVGVLTICGPGTGLGVAQVVRSSGDYAVIETEGGHTDFAPLDDIEDAILKRLREQHTRVSTERVVAGRGVLAIYEILAGIEERPATGLTDVDIWNLALNSDDPLARAALDRFMMALGSVAGDLALAQGGSAVVLAGGLGYRLRQEFANSGFAARFAAKGRFQAMMSAMPVKLITHEHPGLFGAAAAFAQSLADPR